MKKFFKPEDMKQIRYLSWPQISEDGKRTAWVSQRGEEKDGSFPSRIYLLSEGEGPVCLTDGTWNEKQPYFLKDGVHLAYLSDKTGEYQVWLRNLETGRTRQITTLRHGVLRYAFSRKEDRLAFEAVLWPGEVRENRAFLEMSGQEKAAWQEELDWKPYEITELTYKMDEWHGMRKGEFSHIGTVRTDGSNPAILDTGGMEAVFPTWSRNGEKLAFYGYPHTGAKGRQAELFVCHADGSGRRQLTRGLQICDDHAPAFTEDGGEIISMVVSADEKGGSMTVPWVVSVNPGTDGLPAEETASADGAEVREASETAEAVGRPLLAEWNETVCHGVNPALAGRLELSEKSPYFFLTEDGDELYFLSGLRGRTGLYRVRGIRTRRLQPVLELVMRGESDIQAFARNDRGQTVAAVASWTRPAEIYLDGRRLTKSNEWLEEYELAKVEEIWIRSGDQTADLQYFLVHPAAQKEGELYPAVLDIKGGPETMYTLSFWHEFQALAGAGMAVIFGNPRGSAGFGRAFCQDGICWKKEPMEDLLSFVSDAVGRGFIDRAQVGVTGGSYGGYMTNKLIGRTEAFAAAVTQRCLANPATSYGTGDMGFVSAGKVPKNFKMLDYLMDRARENIISYIDQFRTPLLILHAYEDYRCGFEQAEQVFVAMKERNPGVPVRLVMFPGENHGMTRTGKLHHQIRHLEEMVEWFKKYLTSAEDWPERKETGQPASEGNAGMPAGGEENAETIAGICG